MNDPIPFPLADADVVDPWLRPRRMVQVQPDGFRLFVMTICAHGVNRLSVDWTAVPESAFLVDKRVDADALLHVVRRTLTASQPPVKLEEVP